MSLCRQKNNNNSVSHQKLSAETMSESEIVYRDPHTCAFFNIPLPLIKYKDGKTCVFWDVEDYPIPDGHDPLCMKEKIEQALKNQGYIVELSSIQAYVNKNTYSLELEKKYSDANIKLCPLAEGSQLAKAASMFVDVVLWAYVNQYQSNMIVLSKKTYDKETASFASGLFDRGYCILLSTTRPDCWYGPSETEACFLTSLFDGETPSRSLDNNNNKRKRSENAESVTLFDTCNPKFTVAASNMETLFPKGDRRSYCGRETNVIFVIDSLDSIPKDPCKITNHIKSVLKKEFHTGHVSYQIFVAGDDNKFPDDLRNEYMEAAGFFIPVDEDKYAKDYIMLVDILFWAFTNVGYGPENLLIISGNINFGHGKFPAIRRALENNGYYVTVTQLESLMKLEGLPIYSEED